jgi:hypothetical protein
MNKGLLGTGEQGVAEEEVTTDIPPPPAFTIQRLSYTLKGIKSAVKIYQTDNPNFERSLKATSTIKNAYACYREIF